MKRTVVALALTIVTLLSTAAPASAKGAPWAYLPRTTSVCVENHAGHAGDLRFAVHEWNHRAGTHMYLRHECGSVRARGHIITVRPFTKRSRLGGYWKTTSFYTATHRAATGTVYLNRIIEHHGRTTCIRRWLAVHEIGHGFGLVHNHGASVMNDARWRSCGHLYTADVRHVRSL